MDNVQHADHCGPDQEPPKPGTDQQKHCEGEIHGTVTLHCDHHCCCPVTRTFIVNIGPQSEGDLINYLQSTVNAYENMGYQIIAHSLIDAGAGWILGLTVGWCE